MTSCFSPYSSSAHIDDDISLVDLSYYRSIASNILVDDWYIYGVP